MLLIESISNYSKKDIDLGKTPADVYRLCSWIRETFCLSYAIRKDNNLFLYFEKDYSLIQFKGEELKYLGPDERSEALLLAKALDKIRRTNRDEINEWRKSTPGILIRKFSDNTAFMSFYQLISNYIGFLVIDLNVQNDSFESIEISDDDFFIIPTYNSRSGTSDLFKKLKNTKLISISNIKSVENKLLYINFRKDKQRAQMEIIK
ncbi:MAG: hypothetical protein ACFFFT_19340 [Candidatus Thorarchaeota archaeon]